MLSYLVPSGAEQRERDAAVPFCAVSRYSRVLATLKKGEDAQQKNAEKLYDLEDQFHELQGIRNE